MIRDWLALPIYDDDVERTGGTDTTMATSERSPSQKQGENTSKLQGSLDFAKSILDTVREPMLVLDGNLRVRMASRAFCRRFKVTTTETEGCLIYELGNGQWNIPQLRLLLEEIIPRDSVFDDFEVEHNFPNIGTRVMLLNARRVWSGGRHSEFILLAIEDITERHLAEEERRRVELSLAKVNQALVQTAADLTRSNEDLKRFARSAAHDLKSPVNTIVMFSQMLARLKGDIRAEEAQQHLAFIENAAQNLAVLIQDLLSYAVLTQAPLPPETAPAQDAWEAACASLDSAIRESAADVRYDVKSEVSVALPMSLLAQLLQNLIGNAIQYRRENIPLRVSLKVADQGEGFSLWKTMGSASKINTCRLFSSRSVASTDMKFLAAVSVLQPANAWWKESEEVSGLTPS